MKDSTKRTLRTLLHAVLALALALPVLLATPNIPASAQVAVFVAWLAVFTRIYNALEDAGVIPAWLKDVPTTDA